MKFCHWKYDGDGKWDTSCDESFLLEEGTPQDNGINYCPFCGKKVKEAHDA